MAMKMIYYVPKYAYPIFLGLEFGYASKMDNTMKKYKMPKHYDTMNGVG